MTNPPPNVKVLSCKADKNNVRYLFILLFKPLTSLAPSVYGLIFDIENSIILLVQYCFYYNQERNHDHTSYPDLSGGVQ